MARMIFTFLLCWGLCYMAYALATRATLRDWKYFAKAVGISLLTALTTVLILAALVIMF